MCALASSIPPEVPFLDLRPSNEPLKDSLLGDISALLDSNAYTNGPDVALFEAAFAQYCGVPTCVGVASGLDALRLALIASGLEPGDEVIVPAQTFVATAEAVVQAGGKPVVADVSTADYCIDVEAVEAVVGQRTRFVVPVHLFGQLADMEALTRLANTRDVQLIEDACQAHGAERAGHRAGGSSRAGCFSFYPGKNLGAIGDAGAVTTSDEELATQVRALREHGQSAKYRHDVEGYTARLDTIHALVLRHKLARLDDWNAQRRDAAAAYVDRLAGLGDIGLPPVAPESRPVWHLFVITTAEPEPLASFLADHGVGTGRHYPEPLHLAPAYRRLGYIEGAFPVAERLARTSLSLPLFPGISERQLEHVVHTVRAYFDG
jgi:dTDP-4-amino-4,6-dideoxygalactose transaminase